MGTIREMLNPQSVALIGATEKENSIGRATFLNLVDGSNRPVYPVNPNRQTVLGVPCFPSISAVPPPVSLAVIATPARTVSGIVEECGRAGVAGAVILSAGFGEVDPQLRTLKRKVADIRKRYGTRIIGPNCLGLIVPHFGLHATFLKTNPRPGKIALISRSLGDAILDWGDAMGIGFTMFASLGSMIDIGYAELINFLNNDYHTQSLMIYMENVGDAKGFISAARGFALHKPILVLRPGQSKTSSQFIRARAGTRTGDDGVYDAMFKRVGAVKVREVSDLFNMAGVLDSCCLPRGPRLAIITSAGDMGIVATDTLTALGGELATISVDGKDRHEFFLSEQWGMDDPVDMIGSADATRYMNTVEACLRDDGVDGILVIYTPRGASGAIDLARALIEISRKTVKPIIVTWIGGEHAAEGRRAFFQNNVPAYETPEEAVKTFLYMYNYRRNIDLLYETPAEADREFPLKNYLKTVVRKCMKGRRRTLSIEHSLNLLKNYGIRLSNAVVVKDMDLAPTIARDLGLPLSMTIRNLNDKGEDEVITITSEQEAVKVWEKLRQRVHRRANRHQDLEIILQEKTIPDGYRVALGSKRDAEFRTVLFVGPGLRSPGDLCIGLPPLNHTLARRLLEGAEIYKTLKDSVIGQKVLARIEDILLSLSNLIVDFPEIESLTLGLSISGSELVVGDVKAVLARDYENSAQYSHLVITPYPSRYITIWSLPDGTEVLLRPVRPEDEPMCHEMLASLTEETLRVRFFVAREITHDFLIRFCNIDYDQEVSIIAEIKKDGGKKMIGGCQLVRESDSKRGQFAVLVHDDYQKMGLGAKMIDVLIGIAQEKCLDEIHGSALTENYKILAVCRKMGFRVKLEADGISSINLSLKA